MANVLTVPASGAIIFDNQTAGSSTISPLSSAPRLQYDNAGGLNITSYTTGASAIDRFSVDGANGRLFSVSDSLTGVIFSVNDAAGLPIIEVNSTTTDVVNIGTYGTNALVVSGSNVGIGTATPSAKLSIVDTTLAGSGGLSGSALNIAQTWNTNLTPTALSVNVTDLSSNAASLLMDLRVSGSSKMEVSKSGNIRVKSTSADGGPLGHAMGFDIGGSVWGFSNGGANSFRFGTLNNAYLYVTSAKQWRFAGTTNIGWSPGTPDGAADLLLVRDGASGTLAQRNDASPQESRIYGTYSSSGANYERFFVKTNTGGATQVGLSAAGTGQHRSLEFVTGGATRMTVTSAGNVGVGTSTPTFQLDADGTLAIGKITDTTSQGELMRLRVGSSGGSTGYISFKRAGGGNASYNFGLLGNGVLSIRQDGDSADAWSISSSGTVNSNKTFIFGSANGTISSESYFYNSSSGVETLPIRIANPSTGNLSNCAIGFRSINSVGTFYDYAKITGIKIGNWVGATPVGGIGFSVKNGSDAFVEAMRISNNGNVGIGTTSPASKLTVTGGDIEVTDSASGIILKSPDGTRYRITVTNGGALSSTDLTPPAPTTPPPLTTTPAP
jgi:hypothetical protein